MQHCKNRLVQVSGQNTARLRYDPLGRLFEVRDANGGIRRHVYDGDDLVAEYDANNQMQRRWVHGTASGDDPLVSYSGAAVSLANARFLYTDRLGSVVMQADAAGTSVSTYAYDEWGVHGSGQAPPRFGYTGQLYLPEAGLYHYKARMYSPTLGRFLQTDPIGYGDGMNLYRYTGNDPVNGVDPSGLCRWEQNYRKVSVTMDGFGGSSGLVPDGGNFVGCNEGFGVPTAPSFWDVMDSLIGGISGSMNDALSETEDMKDKVADCAWEAGAKHGVDIILDGGGAVLVATPAGRLGTAVVGLSLDGASLVKAALNQDGTAVGLAGVSYVGTAVTPQVAISEAAARNPGALGILSRLGGGATLLAATKTAAEVSNTVNICLSK